MSFFSGVSGSVPMPNTANLTDREAKAKESMLEGSQVLKIAATVLAVVTAIFAIIAIAVASAWSIIPFVLGAFTAVVAHDAARLSQNLETVADKIASYRKYPGGDKDRVKKDLTVNMVAFGLIIIKLVNNADKDSKTSKA